MTRRFLPKPIRSNVLIKTLHSVMLLLAISILQAGSVQAAASVYSWSRTMGGSGMDYGRSIAVDGNGNIYVTGEFRGTAYFDPSGDIDVHVSAGGTDIFLTKINSDGSYGWTKTMGGTEDDYCSSVTVDGSGNVYTTGEFRGTVDFDPSEDGNDLHTSAGERDIFITRINADGTYGWTQDIGGTSSEGGRSVAVDENGNIYVTGIFSGSVDFDFSAEGIDVKISAGNTDIFLTKIYADGSYGWTQKMGGVSVDTSFSAAVDGNGNIYLTGTFQSSVDFDPGLTYDYHTSAGGRDIFITRINSDGSYGWTGTMGGTGNDNGHSVAVDRNGNVYLTGYFYNTVDFDPGEGTDSHTSVGSNDIFLTRLDAEGTYGWTLTMGGTSADSSQSVALDSNGNVYLTGSFLGEVDFDPGEGIDFHYSAGGSIFLTRIKADSSYGWTQTMGSASLSSGTGVTLDGSGNIYVTGYFYGTADFDPGEGVDSYTSAGSYDVFLSKFLKIHSLPWLLLLLEN